MYLTVNLKRLLVFLGIRVHSKGYCQSQGYCQRHCCQSHHTPAVTTPVLLIRFGASIHSLRGMLRELGLGLGLGLGLALDTFFGGMLREIWL